MGITEIIQGIRKEKKVTYDQLAKATGAKSYTNVKNVLSRDGSVNVETAVKLLEALGYEMVIQPKKQGRRPDGQQVVAIPEKGGDER